jgi:hypothetical protein
VGAGYSKLVSAIPSQFVNAVCCMGLRLQSNTVREVQPQNQPKAVSQSQTQVVMGVGVIGLQVDGGAKLAYGILGFTEFEENSAQVRVGLGEIRLDCQGRLEGFPA